MSSATTLEKILVVLMLLTLIVSIATLSYIATLSTTISEIRSTEESIRASMEELARTLGERIEALEEVVKPKPIIMGTTDKITVLDPAKAYDFYTWEVFNNIGEGLLKYKPGTTELEPGIAESYDVSPDGRVYTFKLREGLKFTDGTDLDASAVKYSIERVMRLGLDPSWLVSAFVDAVEVVDTYTVRFILKKAVSYFPALVATPPYFPVSPNSYPSDAVAEPTVGHYGPYRIKSWVRDVELILESNPGYYGPPPKTSTFIVKFYKDASSLRLAVEMGEIDIAWRTLRPMDVQDLKSRGVLTVEEVPGPYIRYLVLRCKDAPFNDVRLRRAVAAAIDRKRIVEEVYRGTVQSLYSMIPAGMWSHIDAFKDEYGERDLALARSLLQEAGYSEAKPFEFELWYTPTHYGDLEADVAAVIKESLEETGMMKVTLRSAEWATYAAEYISAGVMPIFLLGWYPDYIDPDDYTTIFLHSEWSPDMGVFYSNPKMDELLDEASIRIDVEERTVLYIEIQKLMAEEAPVIPLFQGVLNVVFWPNVRGVILDPTMLLRYYLIYKE
ncbi:peptide ABC transporter substrate-binding protein [Candidatus Bathyarchaeota archaeon]|nr:peptide ABC transporter substrate-binding protein [Candidatus Bathyarchaeota archaeon]MBS7617668.1 peptide ABC transporter substrate-binding protein [Candidatus Bathyarchaeota archaeon]